MSEEASSLERPFEITVQGQAEIPLTAERGCFNLSISNQGTNKSTVVNEVIATAKRIEVLLRELSPADDSTEAKESAALAHWDKTTLSSTSHIPRDYEGRIIEPGERIFSASLEYDIRFRDFRALGAFGSRVSSFPYIEIVEIKWVLTQETEKSFRSSLRRMAAKDALDKAMDYCQVLGCTELKPLELSEDGSRQYYATGRSSGRTKQTARKSNVGGHSPAVGGLPVAVSVGEGNTREAEVETGDELEFHPQEIRMSMGVTVKFHALAPGMKIEQ